MKITLLLVLLLALWIPNVLASSTRYALKDHDHASEPVPGNEREHHNFFIPLEVETNITPQRFRRSWFQGVYSTSGVQVLAGEPVWFSGAIAKFDLFPENHDVGAD